MQAEEKLTNRGKGFIISGPLSSQGVIPALKSRPDKCGRIKPALCASVGKVTEALESSRQNVTKYFISAARDFCSVAREINRRALAVSLGAAISVSAAGTIGHFFDIGYDVYYSGYNVGCLHSRAAAAEALAAANAGALSLGGKQLEGDLSYFVKIVPEGDYSPQSGVTEALLLMSEGVSQGCVAQIRGQLIFTAATMEDAQGAIADYIAQNSSTQDAFLSAEVAILKRAVPTSSLQSRAAARQALAESGLTSVLDRTQVVSAEAIPYETVEQTDDTLYRGKRKISVKGVEGRQVTTKRVTLENDTIIAEEILSTQITADPVNEVVLVGTKIPPAVTAGSLARPTDRFQITSRFGSRWGRKHEGIDLAGNIGDPVRATACGKVVFAGVYSGYGNYIKIDHGDGIVTAYGHLSEIGVEVGQAVYEGDVIGLLGNTGRSTGPHLHFEVIKDGVHVNPEPYLK